jgi:hypothetical protein
MANRSRGIGLPSLDAMTGSWYDYFGVLSGAMVPAEANGGSTVPTTVMLGSFPTFSMPPITGTLAGTLEYVNFAAPIPANWSGDSNFRMILWFAQAAAETTGEKFAWRTEYGYAAFGDNVGGTFATADGTLTLGADGTVQYREYSLEIDIPYRNSHGTAEPGGWLGFKLYRRILGTTGEALLIGAQLGYWAEHTGGTVSGTLSAKVLASSRAAH